MRFRRRWISWGRIERYNSEHGDPSIILKIGAHCGPSIAVTLNDNLDYFGQTVNVAARVQSLAEAGEICISEALYSAPGVGQILTGLKIVEFDAPLGEGEAEFAQAWIRSPVA
jgi:class 3 adenylate cyclase